MFKIYLHRIILIAIYILTCSMSSTTGDTQAQNESLDKPFYFTLGPCAESNYCHTVKDNLFPLFATLVQIQRHNTCDKNIFYCDKRPFKPEVFNVITDKPLLMSDYNPRTMEHLTFGIPSNQQELAHCFDLFLNQLHERFGITYEPNKSHKKTITLVQRYARCRMITNLEQLQKRLQQYCNEKRYLLNIVNLEHASFQHQLQLLAHTDIFIACHGAALVNAPFMRKNGTTIEIMPYNFSYDIFRGFTVGCRPDILYHKWTLQKNACFPVTSKSPQKEQEFRYWRDQNIFVNPELLIQLITSLIKPN